MERENKIESGTPKIRPLGGFIEARYVKCGRPNCRCATGTGHGPYHYWIYKRGNRKYKKYVKKEDVPMISAGIELRRKQTKEFREISQAAKQRWRIFKVQLREFKKEYSIR